MRVSYVVLFVTAAIFANAIARPSSSSRAKNLERRVRSVLFGNRFPKSYGYNPYPQYQDTRTSDYAPAVPDWSSQNHQNGNQRGVNFNEIDQQFVSPVKNQRVFDNDIDSNMGYADRADSEDSNDSDESRYDGNNSDDSSDSDDSNDSDESRYDSNNSDDSNDSSDSDRWFDEGDDSVKPDDWQSQDDQQENQQDEVDVQKPVQEYLDMSTGLDSEDKGAGNDWEQEKGLRGSINPRVGSGSAISGRNNLDYSWDEKSAPLQEQWDKRPMESKKNSSPPSYSCIDICEQVEFNHRDLPEIRSLCDCSNYATSYIRK